MMRGHCCIIVLLALLLTLTACAPKAADESAPAKPTPTTTELKLLTFNVLADRIHEATRVPALMEILKESDADIIVLQEVAPWFAQRLLRQEWVKGYQLPQKNGRPVLAYEYLLLSKYPIESFTLVDLPGRQKRKFFMAVVKVDERKVSIGTCHLESMLEDGPTRAKQLDIAFAELAKTDDAIFLGDFNFGDGEQPDTAHLNVAYVDAWMTLHPKRSGYTWDIETSPMARAGSFPNEPSRRIDRVLVRSELWKPKSIAIIGNTPVSKETPHIFPSDHFGLLATLELKD